MLFRQIQINDKEKVSLHLKNFTKSLISDFDFVSSFIWSSLSEYFLAEENGALYLQNRYDNKIIFAPPIAPEKEDLTPYLVKIQQFTKRHEIPLLVRGIDNDILKRIDPRLLETLKVTYDRDNAEYVYLVKNLIELSETKQLRDKKNRILKFENSYNYIFREYTTNDYEKLFELFNDWTEHITHEITKRECCALKIALDNYEELGIKCGVIEIDGKIAAFSAGSLMFSGQPQILFEKADVQYYGIYQAINKYFLEHFFKDYTYVNRQEDLGIEGLRRAKMSYSPVYLIDKYKIEEKD